MKGELAAPKNFGANKQAAATKIIADHDAEEARRDKEARGVTDGANRIQGAEVLKNAKKQTEIQGKSFWLSCVAIVISIAALLVAFFK